jgi:thymidylate synthase
MDLGKVYGYQWRNFNSQDYDQLESVLKTLKTDSDNRRMLVSAWNPLQFNEMALPPCHVMWGVNVVGNKLNLWWMQRSVDVFLGLPYNLASYATLLKILCKESNMEEGILTGFLADVHVYENHIEQSNLQLSREPYDLPNLNINNFKNIFEWEYTDLELENYQSHPTIKAPIAV